MVRPPWDDLPAAAGSQPRRPGTSDPYRLTMPTTTSPSQPKQLLEPTLRRTGVLPGIAGITAIVLLGAFVPLSSSPDVTTTHAAPAIIAWLQHPPSTMHVHLALALSALTYPLLIIFAAGVHKLVREWDSESLWPTVTLIGFALFFGGALASDAFEWAVPLALDTTHGLTPSAPLVAVLDRGWLIALTEAQVALSIVIIAFTVSAMRARRRGARVPRVVIAFGVIAAAAAIPLVVDFTALPVFLVSNQLRLVWIVSMAIWLLLRRSASGISELPTEPHHLAADLLSPDRLAAATQE